MIKIVGVRLGESDKTYDFINKHDFSIKTGDKVECKVNTGGTALGKVVYTKEIDRDETRKDIKYKNIVEVINLKKIR